MKRMASALVALALALLLAAPALAGDEEGDTVTKTLELTLHGEVPRDRAFGAFYYVSPDTHPAGLVQFCGPQVEGGEPPSQIVSEDDCVGDGSVYTAEVSFERGTGVFTEFITLSVEDPQHTLEVFAEMPELEEPEALEYEVLEADTTNSAWYSFTLSDDQQAPGMPETGAGGTSDDQLSIGRAAIGLLLFALGGLILYRRRVTSHV